MSQQIRNFSIIAHIDHGKSTLADRMLEMTKTVTVRKMREQVLDSMELERERGITIKMQPVRMEHVIDGTPHIYNLIDTPGHIDFSYEVSRALKAVEGVLLLVDSTQGVQAQTLTTLQSALDLQLVIIPVLTKTDMPHARVHEVTQEIQKLVGCTAEEVVIVSGKTGDGVPQLLNTIAERIPAPEPAASTHAQGLVFDFEYSSHKGIILYQRVFDGNINQGDNLRFIAGKKNFTANEVGVLNPEPNATKTLTTGEIGYVVTGIKEPGIVSVGDTICDPKQDTKPLEGYQESRPVIWASIFPENQDDFSLLQQSLERLKLSDSSLSFEEESSGILGRGFRCGFLGMLHLEIVTERLKREFSIALTVTSPSIAYRVEISGEEPQWIYNAARFPEHLQRTTVFEPWILGTIMSPGDYVGNIMTLLYEHEATVLDTEVLPDGRNNLTFEMPLRELMRTFFDRLKNATSGYGSLTYEIAEERSADVARLDILVAEEPVPAFSRIVGTRRLETEARALVEKLYNILPKQQFVTKIQAKSGGKIIASKTLSALRKDVTAKLYGGDVTRKMKLREKQKKGKKKMLERGSVHIPQDVFMQMLKSE
jgi:GTP-binding protein LepA